MSSIGYRRLTWVGYLGNEGGMSIMTLHFLGKQNSLIPLANEYVVIRYLLIGNHVMNEGWFLTSLIIFCPLRHLRTTLGDHIPITCDEVL